MRSKWRLVDEQTSAIFMGLLSLQVRSPADPLSGTQVDLEREEG